MAIGKNIMELIFRVKADGAKKDIKQVGDGLKKVGIGGKVAQKGLGFMSKGFKGVGLAMKAAGIGLFVGLLSQLTGLFSQNQKTADTFSRIMIKLQPVFDAVGKVVEVLAAGLEKMVDWIVQAIDWIGGLIGLSTGFGDSVNASADALVNQRKKVQLLEAELGLLQLQYQREAELMRQIRDDESLSIQERIDANFELGKVLEQQLQHEKSVAMESLRLAELELSRNKENIDLQVELTNAKTKLAEIDERITGQRSEQLTNLNSLNRDRAAQQKEAATKREEQLKKEAEMLQNLIDLQNEDIETKKKAYKTINEQFDNAEEANKAQIDALEKRKKAELAALDASVQGAKKNIEAQKGVTAGIEEELVVLEDTNKKKKQSVEDLIQEEIKAFSAGSDNFSDYNKKIESVLIDKEEELLKRRQRTLAAEGDDRITSLEEYEKYMEEYIAITQDKYDDYIDELGYVNIYNRDQHNANIGVLEDSLTRIKNAASLTNDAIVATTEEQLNQSMQSAASSEQIIANSINKRLEIEKRYAKEIEATELSLDDTTLKLQEQADEKLFLHFETAQQKEIRLATEKYAELLGASKNNAEMTKRVEDDKVRALEKINQKYIDAQKVDKTEFNNYLKVQDKNAREKELMELEEHLAKVLAIEGLSDEEKLLAEEEYIRRWDELNDKHNEEDLEKKKAKQRELEDMALQGMNLMVAIAGENAKKELSILEKKFKNGEMSEKEYVKQKNAIEKKQAKKERNAALVQIAVDTARGISAAVKAGAGVPFPANIAAIATGVLSVLSGIAAAKAAMNESAGAGETDLPGDTDTDTGEDNTGAVPGITFGAAGSEQAPVQAYVVETDISNAQALQSELDLQSTL